MKKREQRLQLLCAAALKLSDGKNTEEDLGSLVGLLDYMIEAKELSGERIHESRMRMRAELEEYRLRGEDF